MQLKAEQIQNQVLFHKIHQEALKHETKYIQFNQSFNVNPTTLNLFSFKPNQVEKGLPAIKLNRSEYDINTQEIQSEDKKIKQAIINKRKTPRSLYKMPATTNQEIGWISQPLFRSSSCLRNQTKKSCYETAWANNYQLNIKKSPFTERSRYFKF